MFKISIFKQNDNILKDRSIQKIHVVTKVSQNLMTLTFNSLRKMLNQRTLDPDEYYDDI